ncbi:chemotaxis protein CheC [uncultured Gammaproteobacteria bacterium]
MLEFSPEVKDALTEIFNIGIGQAADVLSTLVNEEVELSVPEVGIDRRADFVGFARAQWTDRASVVREDFTGPFSGDALLIFPVQQSLELVRSLLPDSVVLETMTELEREAMIEVGNVVLNACLSSIADILEREFTNSLPTYIESEPATLIEQLVPDPERYIIYLRIEFVIHSRNIRGFILFVLDLPAIDAFVAAANQLVNRFQ